MTNVTVHKDGTSTVWDVFNQYWFRGMPSNFTAVLRSSLGERDLARVDRNEARARARTLAETAKLNLGVYHG